MTGKQRRAMKEMRMGQKTDIQAAQDLSLSVEDVRGMFLSYSKEKKAWRRTFDFLVYIDVLDLFEAVYDFFT